MIKKGTYRSYIRLGKYGIKFARFNLDEHLSFNCFLAGIIMNRLERERYKRFKLRVKDARYPYEASKYNLCPTYFSCGLFNIVAHGEEISSNLDPKKFHVLSPFVETDKLNSFGYYKGVAHEIDYGDFTIYGNSMLTLHRVDYR